MKKAEPKYTLLSGQVKLTVLKSDKGKTLLALERIYKDKETGKWKSTNYFQKRDVQDIIAVVTKFLTSTTKLEKVEPKKKDEPEMIDLSR